ncbi:MAG: response regulator [Methylobacter sp.]
MLVSITVAFGLLAKLYIDNVSNALFGITDNNGKSVEYATGVERMALASIMEEKNYLLFEKDETFQRAEEDVRKLYAFLDQVDQIAHKYKNHELLSQSKNARESTAKYADKYRAGVAALKANKQAVNEMVEKGGIVAKAADNFLTRQVSLYQDAMKKGAGAQELNGYVQRYIVATKINVKAMEIMRAEKEEVNYKNRIAWNKMQIWLPELIRYYDDLQKISETEEALRLIDDARNATREYQQAAESWIQNDDNLKVILKEMSELGANVINQAQTAEEAGYNQLDVARNQAETLVGEANKIIVGTIAGALVLGVIIAWVITGSVTGPLEFLRGRMMALASGDLSVQIPLFEGNTELTAMAQSVQVFKDAAIKLDTQRWIKATVSDLSATLQSLTTIVDFAQQAISRLVVELGGGAGVFYYWNETDGCLELLGSYGLKKRRHLAARFKLGESLVGQAALERTSIILTEVPDDYTRIVSGIGETSPRTLLVAPVLSKGKVLAVVEIGSFTAFTPEQQALIDEILPSLALNLELLERNNRTLALLDKTQRQTEELRASSEELRAQSDQLQVANEELRKKSDALQQQAEELRASEEELRSQREELSATNEELAIKGKNLEEQAAQLEEARVEAEKRALERDTASRYKSEFLANMSHELRTPLNSLLILARSLRDNEEGNLTDDQVESAGIIHESGTSLLRLINDILDLSKVEAGKMEMNVSHVRLNQFAATLQQRFHLLAENKGLGFNIQSAADLPASVYIDSGKLEQILNNLIGNAVKFTEQGQVSVTIKRPEPSSIPATVGLAPEQAIEFEISDTGIGIPNDKIDAVFQAFEQVDGSTSRRYGGTGLGLTISKRLAQFLGGDIDVISVEGQGSTFRLILPQETRAQKSSQFDAAATAERVSMPENADTAVTQKFPNVTDDRETISARDETILIIEDDEKFAKIVRNLSRKRGFKCLVAEDGAAGLELARRYRPTGIVLDVGLPGMNGWAVMEKLKECAETRHIPVHFMSATDASLRGLEMGAVGFFTKPVSKEQIESAFERIRHFTSSSQRCVLVVDDDAATRKAVKTLLASEDIQIIESEDAEAALIQLQSGRLFDCMILDLTLPGMSGVNFLESCTRQQIALPPVIVYSGQELSNEQTLALREYTDSIVIKGARSPERLLDEVTLFLHSVKANLPLAQQQQLNKPEQKLESVSGRTVLIVDDDMRNTFALSKVLRSKGLNILMAQDGLKAISQLEANPSVDLVLMDIMMPGMDGYTAIRKIRQEIPAPSLPIIALTAKAMIGDREKCLEAGANDYLSKPVDIDDLMAMMMRCWKE